jgi:hypothetical protein
MGINGVKMRTDISVSNMSVISKYLAMNYPSLRCVCMFVFLALQPIVVVF